MSSPKQEKRLKVLAGLAMLLVDVAYNGEIFDMDRANLRLTLEHIL
ncbi:MAG: hypothetical protein U9Q38_06270 [Thermodesulfobacteriota bacterium]|nr:hypothetical protein [Thermodesulfobacteriota bacterium]